MNSNSIQTKTSGRSLADFGIDASKVQLPKGFSAVGGVKFGKNKLKDAVERVLVNPDAKACEAMDIALDKLAEKSKS